MCDAGRAHGSLLSHSLNSLAQKTVVDRALDVKLFLREDYFSHSKWTLLVTTLPLPHSRNRSERVKVLSLRSRFPAFTLTEDKRPELGMDIFI